MAKKTKTPASNKKKSSAKPASKAPLRSKAAAKYDQPGAPWWKKVAPPMPK